MKISIVITCYNYGHFVADAICSCLYQTYPDFEVIVVDDGSTDNSASVIKKFGEDVVYVYQHNQGLSAARNTGIRHASGEFILNLDADDWISPRILTDAVKLIEDDSTIVSSTAHLVDENLKRTLETWPDKSVTKNPNDYGFYDLIKHNMVSQTSLFSKNKWKECGGFDTTFPYLEDWDFWIRMTQIGCKIKYLDPDFVYYKYRQLEGGMLMTASKLKNYYSRYDAMLSKYFKDITTRRDRIKLLYQIILNRTADRNGLNHYDKSNLSLHEIKDAMLNSEEYKKLQGTQ